MMEKIKSWDRHKMWHLDGKKTKKYDFNSILRPFPKLNYFSKPYSESPLQVDVKTGLKVEFLCKCDG